MAQPKRVRKRTALRKGFATGKTALEWQLYHAQGLPGPGHYRPNDTRGAATGGHFSEHYNPSALERLCRMKGELPSPMSYDVHAPRSARGIKFTSGGGKTELDIIMQEMAGRPGPGHYGDTGAAYKCEGSQKFAMASRDPPTLSDKRPTPGPTDYDPPPSLSERGVALQGRGRSYLEDLNRSRRDNPGPGHYDIDAAEKHTRAGAGCRLLGRPKFYLEELYYTRRDNPGPGAYGIVEAAPPSQVACRFGSGALEEDDEVSIGSILSDGGVTRKTLETLRAKAERRPVRLVAGELTLSVDNVASTLTLDTLSPSGGGGGGGGGGPAAIATTLAVAAAGGGGGKVAWAKPPSPIKMEPIAV
jgi:hypothetical protein